MLMVEADAWGKLWYQSMLLLYMLFPLFYFIVIILAALIKLFLHLLFRFLRF